MRAKGEVEREGVRRREKKREGERERGVCVSHAHAHAHCPMIGPDENMTPCPGATYTVPTGEDRNRNPTPSKSRVSDNRTDMPKVRRGV